MHVIGTAGHVDHGKSSLVASLTGTHPDRWIEERLRGMTLDLGFAHLRYDDVEAGIVDVPGHERFLHNMLAGAAGMELLLLVVAANEGPKPQTFEHLNVLRFLSVRRVVVVLTKIDLIPSEERTATLASMREQLCGTIAEDAPAICVSTVTGENIDALKELLHDELAALEGSDSNAPVYLPIDRVFSLAGRGTIVTGTLMQGRIATGDTLAIAPAGTLARVRSLHVFGSAKPSAARGSRVAINVPGIETHQIARGDVLADPAFQARTTFAVAFCPLADARELLKRRTAVRAYIGSAEVLGTLVLPKVPDRDEFVGGELFLKAPVLAFPGVRFVLRRVSPKTLLGGGELLASATDVPETSPHDPTASALLAVLRDRGSKASDVASLAFAANLREDVVTSALASFVQNGDVLRVARPEAYVASEAAEKVLASALAALEAAHAREPWTMGMTSLALARALTVDESDLVRVLHAFAEEGRLLHRGGYFAANAHVPTLSAEQRAFFETHVPVDPAQPFLPVDYAAVAALAQTARIPGLVRAMETLLARGVLVRVGEALYRGSQIEGIHRELERYLEANGRVTMAEFRNVLGTSRKYAVPLLEWFDGRGITVRNGDYRTLRARKGTVLSTS